MLIDKTEIERVKRANELVAFIRARGVKLTQRGKQLVGLCPFHDDHEPSLVVDARKQLWNCLGACHEGGFTGQERDSETGLDYMNARYFASTQGRFSSADSVAGSPGNPQSLNRYAYVGNNPLNFSDPTGHLPSSGQGSAHRSNWDDPTSPDAVAAAYGALPEALQNESNAWALADAAKNGCSNCNFQDSGPLFLDGDANQSQNPAVVFDRVELLDSPGAGYPKGPLGTWPEVPVAAGTRVDNASDPNTYRLDLDAEKVDPYSVLAIRVAFHASKGFETDPSLISVSSSRGGTQRYSLLEEYLPGSGRKATQADYGQVIFRVKSTRLDAAMTSPDVTVTVEARKNPKFTDLNNQNYKAINYEKLYLQLRKIN